MTFNDQLHADLFDLFIIKSIYYSPFFIAEGEFEYIKTLPSFKNIKELFPLINHPEQYEVYVSDWAIHYLKKGSNIQTFLDSEPDENIRNKITITIEEEW